MNIVVLEGSPNKNGSSNLLAEQFIRGATQAGHSVQAVDVAHANIHPCTGCGGGCENCSSCCLGGGDPYKMYQDYIVGKKEISEINAEYRARYLRG